MNKQTRRSFVRTAGQGLALSALPFGMLRNFSDLEDRSLFSGWIEDKLTIGIVGAENSHTAAFGKLFNVDKKFPGVQVEYVWGETPEFAQKASEQGQIPHIVKDPAEMLGKVQAVIVDHRHPKYHLPAAMPFIEAGIPTFVDKPFCYRVAEGRPFLARARELGTPVTSYSSIAYSSATFDIRDQVADMEGDIKQIIAMGPADLDSPYGGIFFYGVHLVQPLMFIFGEDIHRVRITRQGKSATATLAYPDDRLATLIFKTQHYGWETWVETHDGIKQLQSRVPELDPPINDTAMVAMFKTGNEPRSHDSILRCVAVLEALEKSATTEQWVEVEQV